MTAPVTAISSEGLAVSLGGKAVLRDLSVEFRSGQICAVVGPNGAGKTTLLKALLRLIDPDQGAIFLDGEDISDRPPHKLAGRVGYLPQSPGLHWPLSVEAMVALGLPGRAQGRKLTGVDGEAVTSALQRLDVTGFRERSVFELSGGERARVLLARLLAGNAGIMMADEPTLSLDPRHRIAIMETFREEAAAGKCVVIVMHDLLMAERYADRIVVIDGGRLAAEGPAAEALSDEVLDRVFGITRAELT